ncbi:MAG: carbohydrate ABC transporter permease [Chloroflexi bacterium]|nr:MAG: carbohydrate ABC transporter permease [Chloroflexota bacterium]
MEATQYQATYSPRTHTWSEYLSHRAGDWLRLVLLFAASIIILAPVVWTLSTSLRTPAQSFSVPPQWIPLRPDWSNYFDVFQRVPFATYVVNSFVVTGAIVLGQLVTASLAGYAFARLNFPFRNALFWLVMATVMVPLQATIIPVFVLISSLGLADTLASLILPALPTAFGTFLLRQYFMSMPNDYEEAALIDGANQWQVFYRVYLPMATPGLAILTVLSFNTHWNEFFRPLIFLSTNENFTLPLGVVTLFGYLGTGSVSVVLAGVVLSLIPVLVVYTIGQRYLIEGIAMGGLKG